MAVRNLERRREILSSAFRLIEGATYDKVSLSDIAKGAGINKSLLQRYYPQKIDLIKEMLTTLLETSFGYMDRVPGGEEDLFQKISNCNMLFFAGVAADERMYRFILSTVGSSEILDVWIDTICGWLHRYAGAADLRMLDLRCALCFAMGGTMHLFQHQEELGIDYRFFCEKHIRAILSFLGYRGEKIEAICAETAAWMNDADVRRFTAYCQETISWIPDGTA